MINEPISQQICALVIAGNILNSGSAAVPVPGRKPQLRIRLPGSFKLAHLNRIQSFLMLSITPVLFLLWQVKISADRPICWLSESEPHLLHSSNPWEYINTFFFAVLIILLESPSFCSIQIKLLLIYTVFVIQLVFYTFYVIVKYNCIPISNCPKLSSAIWWVLLCAQEWGFTKTAWIYLSYFHQPIKRFDVVSRDGQ